MLFRRIISLSVLAYLLQCDASYGQEIWFSPRSAPAYANEFYGLFDKEAPWKETVHKIKAFEISVQLQTNASIDQLEKVIAGLRERHIAFGLGMLPLTGLNGCGYQVEGYAAELQKFGLAKRLKSLGGDVAFYDMDEPLYYGHFFNGERACKSSLQELVRTSLRRSSRFEASFPELRSARQNRFRLTSPSWKDG